MSAIYRQVEKPSNPPQWAIWAPDDQVENARIFDGRSWKKITNLGNRVPVRLDFYPEEGVWFDIYINKKRKMRAMEDGHFEIAGGVKSVKEE